MSKLDNLDKQLAEKREQLMEYILGIINNEDPVVEHARLIAEGRIAQIDEIRRWLTDSKLGQ